MHVYLTDFGLARDTATGSRFTRTGTTLGTPAYMSPEQARGELAALTPATDVWGLGCVLYECVAGRRAFEGDTDAAVVGQVLLAEPGRLASVAPQIPRGLDVVVHACLAKRATARYRNSGTLRDELDRVRRDERPQARAPSPWRWKAVAVVLAVAAVATLVAVAWPRPEDGPASRTAAAASEAEGLAARAKGLRTADPRQAADLLRRALDLAPSRDDWRLERGLLLWAVGEGAEARWLWSEIRPESPAATAARLYRGLEAFFRLEGGRLHGDEARPDLQAVAAIPALEGRLATAALAALDERWPQARRALRGEAQWESALLRGYVEDVDPEGDRSAAVREYTRALDEGIRFAWALNNRGVAREDQGDTAGAIADYDHALALNPRYAQAWKNRGIARQAQGDLLGAIEDYGKALGLDPGDIAAWNNRGLARTAHGDLSGAIDDFRQALERSPGDADVWFNRGVARSDQGDLAGAIADYGKALEVDPRHAEAWYNRGVARAVKGDLAEAIVDYERSLVVAPPGWPYRAATAQVLARARAALAARGGK